MVISQKFRKLVALQCSQNNYSIEDQSDRLCKPPNQRFFACKPENKLIQAVYLIWRIRAYLIYVYIPKNQIWQHWKSKTKRKNACDTFSFGNHCSKGTVYRLGQEDLTHCYSLRSNLKKMIPLQFCLPIFLGIHRNPKQKEFFNSRKGFWR